MKRIKFIVLVVAAFFAATTSSFAQTYTISPSDTVIVNSIFGIEEELVISQINNTAGTIQIKYQKIMADVPSLWEAVLCDNQNCFPLLPLSGTMNVLAGHSGYLSVHCTAYTNPGTAVIRYAIWDANTPNSKDTLTFIMNVSTTGIALTGIENTSVWMSKNKLHLRNNHGNYSSLHITDLSGREVFKTTISTESEIELPALPTAVYIVGLNGKEKSIVRKVFYRE